MQPQYTDMMLTRFTCNMLSFFQAAKEAETRANAEQESKALQDKLANIATIQQAVRRGKVVRNAGGGDCLPRAISQHKFGTENNHELVRTEICELIRASWEHLEGFAVDENGSQMTMNQAIKSFGKHEWMGEFGLIAASMYLGARIQVWCDTGKYPPPRSYPEAEEATMMPDCHLLRTNENHYEYFIPHADEESDEDDSESGEEGSESEEEGSESEEEGSESEEEGSESEDERSDEDEQSDVSESERDDAGESEEESEEDSESEEEEPDEASNPEDPEDDESETKSATSEYQR